MFEESPANINDVVSPGTTAAAPFSRPIVVTDQPVHEDPMVTEALAEPIPAGIQADQPAASFRPPSFAERATAVAAETPDHFHSLQHEEAFAHDVKHRRFSPVGIIVTVLLMAGAAFLGYYLTKSYLLDLLA